MGTETASAAPASGRPPGSASAYPSLLSPLRLKGLTLRNRVMSSAHAPVYTDQGVPGERYQLYHEEKAKGGIALTMFGGSSSVARDSSAIYSQIYVGSDRVVPYFRQLAARVHRHGAALMCQITHMGRRTSWDSGDWFPTIAPSVVRDPAHHSVPRAMSARDIARVVKAFGEAARRCRDGELDGCEILTTTHLLGQFLSPLSNRREDGYGGSLESRARFMLEVIEAVRNQVGADFIVGVRYTANESNEDGLTAEEGIEIGRLLARTGMVDFLNVNGRYAGTTVGNSQTYPGMESPAAPFIMLAKQVREASGLPVFQAARIPDLASAEHAVAGGFLDMVGMTRPHIADPHLLAKLARGEEARIRPCVGANYCMDRAYSGRDSLCFYNAATGREATMPHVIAKSPQQKKVVVVGGGPAGLEAARVCGERGHRVVLFEAAAQVGGQLRIAARGTWRKDLLGAVRWFESELRHLAIEVRVNRYAGLEEILAEAPDVVVIATGGTPLRLLPEGGGELATTSWDVLDGQVPVADRVLVYDETGNQSGLSAAEFVAQAAREVEIVTPEREVGQAVGGLNYSVHLRNLYRAGVRLTPDNRLRGITKVGNQLVARLRNDYSRAIEERRVDQVILECGTAPEEAVFTALLPQSRNLGDYDTDAFADGRLETEDSNPEGRFLLFRVGDAVASRNVHAAVYDALRICKDI